MDDPLPPPQEPARPASETRTRRLPLDAAQDPGFQSDPCWLDQIAEAPPCLAGGARVGPYEVEGLLGRGGMATVYRAREVEGGRPVALKVLDPRLAADSRSLRRFRQEARLAAQLRHPRIVSVLACGEDGGHAWLSMPLVAGPTLEQVVERDGPIPPAQAAAIVSELAWAVEAAHRQGVIHRDLKPGNVLLHPRDGPLVLDLGLAKDQNRDVSLSGSGDVLGTPVYVAPEVAAGRGTPDHRVDVYGLGAVLQYALTGHTLYAGDSPLAVLRQVVNQPPPRLRQVDPRLPAQLEAICDQALAREPEDRYPSAAALAEDLRRFLDRTGVQARPPGLLRRAARAGRRHPWRAAALGAALLALLLAPPLVDASARRLARRQRAEQGQQLLESARAHAAGGAHGRAAQALQHATLLAEGAFLEDPADPHLRANLMEIKRARVAHAEAIGHWELAEELRQGLDRLGEPQAADAPAARASDSLVRVRGLAAGERLVLRGWSAAQGLAGSGEARQVAADGELTLAPGAWLALHVGPAEKVRGCYLMVLDPGRAHELALDQRLPAPPPGLWRLPGVSELEALTAQR